jgi:hypothetical protein
MKTLLLLLMGAVLPVAAQQHSITFTWTWDQAQGDPATGFHVQCGPTNGGPYSLVGTVSVTTLTYTYNQVTAGTRYWCVVTAYNSAGDSPASNQVSVLVPATTQLQPPLPVSQRIQLASRAQAQQQP